MVYQTTFFGKEIVATDTMAFYLECPRGFLYEAGQSIDISFSTKNGDWSQAKSFSLASIPSEPRLMICTRNGVSEFKHSLFLLPLGAPIRIEGPFGSNIFARVPERNIVGLIGGIGITPFRSMLFDALGRRALPPTTLLYSNRSLADAAFDTELARAAINHKNFTYIPTVTNPTATGEVFHGYITADLIKDTIELTARPLFYCAGSLRFVVGMRSVLDTLGVSDDDVVTEEFTGY